MLEYDIVYRDIRLRISCPEEMMFKVINYFSGHVVFEMPNDNPTYQLVVDDNFDKEKCLFYRKVNKWFDYSSLDFYINNSDKICYMMNICASSNKNRDLLICTSVANLFHRLLELKGYLGVHAACVEKDNKGLLFVAERKSGKTICILNLINNGYNIVGNDVIALKKDKNDLIGYGIPQTVSIRLGKVFCEQEENKKYLDIARKKGIEINHSLREEKNINLTVKEVAKINSVSQTVDVPIKFIIRPKYDPGINHLFFYKMPIEQTRELVYSQYKSLVHETSDFLINIKLEGVDEKERYSHLEEVINIPAHYCIQNEHTTEEFVKKMELILRQK